jgi:rhomboid family GlyGly-CTERM serine protease
VTGSSRSWAGIAALLGLAALAGWFAAVHAAPALDWQPGRAAAEPWRAWSAVAVHYSVLHLGANLAGVLLVGAFGIVADVPARIVWAWLLAWPLTHWGLLVRPELTHYGGLSGVLHAGVAAVALHLLVDGPRRRRMIGLAVLAGLTIKVFGEVPWGPAVTHPPGWDIAVAPIAHASGTLAGLLCALGAILFHALRRPARAAPPAAP